MRDTITLCDSLGVVPTPDQYQMMRLFHASPGVFDLEDNASHEAARGLAMCMLWKTLRTQGANSVVIAPDHDTAADFMDFLRKIGTRMLNAPLAMVRFPQWNVMEFAGMPFWNIRFLPNRPLVIENLGKGCVMSLVLKAGDTTPEFVETLKALEAVEKHHDHHLIRVW